MTSIPKATVYRWLRTTPSRSQRRVHERRLPDDWSPPNWPAYAYLLGMYLGDGCIGHGGGRGRQLGIYLDASYPGIVQECAAAVEAVMPTARVTRHLRKASPNTAVVRACRPWWPDVFPQHGPGKKHLRRIWLAPWQRQIVDRNPRRFLRGLIHSDGCRAINQFTTQLPSGRLGHYEYVRYFFSNLSDDIRALFCEYCERVGVRWTQSNPRNISVSDRQSVAILDDFIGPKDYLEWQTRERGSKPDTLAETLRGG